MYKVKIVKSQKNTKRLRAILTNTNTSEIKAVDFGSPTGFTYFDGATDIKRNNYIKRHKASGMQDWKDPFTAGFWSRWLLWEDKKQNMDNIISAIKSNSKINIVDVMIGKI
jgi:hypothetical protein